MSLVDKRLRNNQYMEGAQMMSNEKALEILQRSLDKGLLCICGGMFSNTEISECREALNTALSALSGEHGQLKKKRHHNGYDRER